MIYVTGDTHGYYNSFLKRLDCYSLDENDYVIVCGDFGFVFSEQQAELLEAMKGLPFNILFVDGNHENFIELYKYPLEKWNGGTVHRISGNILHLTRGQVYNIDNKSFFTMGGAYSTDRGLRIDKISWWKEEMPVKEEYLTALASLESCGYKVDYIITHTAPASAIIGMGLSPNPRESELTELFDMIYRKVEYKRWFFGHFHSDIEIDNKHCCLFHNVIPVD